MNRRKFISSAGLASLDSIAGGRFAAMMRRCVAGGAIGLETLIGPEEAHAAKRVVHPKTSDGRKFELHPDYQPIFHIGSGFRDRLDLENRRRSGRHFGIDYVAPKGTPIVSPGDGFIVENMSYPSGPGRTIVLKDPRSSGSGQFKFHLFHHLAGFAKVRIGQRLRMGQVIGYVGNTGTYVPLSRTSHLHHEVREGIGIEENDRDLIVVARVGRKYEKLSRRDIKHRIGRALNPLDDLIRVKKNANILYLPTALEFAGHHSRVPGNNLTPILTPKKKGKKGYIPN